MHDYLISISVISLFVMIGAKLLNKKLKKYKNYQKYALLASLFLLILIISEMMREGFAVSGWAIVILLAGSGTWYLVKRFYKNKSISFNELPKMIGFAASYAIAADLGQAIAVLFSVHYLFYGGLLGTKYKLKAIAKEQFKFLVLGIIVFTIFLSLKKIINIYMITMAAGMLLYVVVEEGFLKKI